MMDVLLILVNLKWVRVGGMGYVVVKCLDMIWNIESEGS
jgi:hypothetical protein